MIDNEYLAYVAGIFDGEGCVSLVRCNPPPCLRSPRACITQKGQREFLDEIKSRWGGTVVQKSCGADEWQAYSALVVKRFLTDILPWLRFKREKAIITLAICEYCVRDANDKEKLGRVILERKFEEVNSRPV